MIELPEARALALQADKLLPGLKVIDVVALHTPHKFCWMNLQPEELRSNLVNRTIAKVTSSAHYLRFLFTDGSELYAAGDMIVEYKHQSKQSDKHQLALHFDNEFMIEFRVKMYGFIGYGMSEDLAKQWQYYRCALEAVDPLSDEFSYEHFVKVTRLDQQAGSIKQALATDQHIPGLGNGVLQDILFNARIAPKRKVATLTEPDKRKLYQAVIETLKTMVSSNGRDSHNLLDGTPGGYHAQMTSNASMCPICHGSLTKETYLGGKVIYCPNCQQ